jgi:putative addiction module component (TIGR02574 family)
MSLPAIDIDRLTVEERLQLIENLWASFQARPEELPVTAAQQAELERRMTAYNEDPTKVVPLAEIKRRYELD